MKRLPAGAYNLVAVLRSKTLSKLASTPVDQGYLDDWIESLALQTEWKKILA